MEYKFIAAALAVIPIIGIGFGMGHIGATIANAIAKNPEAEPKIFKSGIISLALCEALGLFSLLVALLIIYA